MGPLRVRWLGRVPYNDALALQRALFTYGREQHLLLLEHPSVYTLGVRADASNVLVDPASVGADLVTADRGGDVTFHGPGQLVGYPIVSLESKRRRSSPSGSDPEVATAQATSTGPAAGMADTVAYVRSVEQLIIDSLAELGINDAGRLRDYPGVWVDVDGDHPRKIAAIGVKLSRGRTMHGFALNVSTDLAMFGHIVPCGIVGKAVTSMAAEGVDVPMSMVVDVIARRAADLWGSGEMDRADVVWRERPDDLSPFSRGEGAGEKIRIQTAGPSGIEVTAIPAVPAIAVASATGPSAHLERRLAQAGVSDGLTIGRKPDWMRVKLDTGPTYRKLRSQLRSLELTTVCEEAGCPNIFDCWNDGTATFMVLGERCTRACGFCLVDTRKPEPVDADEP
ncbi:MAG: lipoyl synthase, partial [Acidimicrobiia bacterium]